MKIRSLRITFFKSLCNVEMSDLSTFTVLIGENSSGKTNLFEAINLFFADFQSIDGVSQGLNSLFWFRKDTRVPIKFHFEIELTNGEYNAITSIADGQEWFSKILKRNFQRKHRVITIIRKLLNIKGEWKTESIKIGDFILVKDNEVSSQDMIFKTLNIIVPYELVFFTRPHNIDNPGGTILLIDTRKHLASQPTEQNLQFGRDKIFKARTSWTKPPEKWLKEKGYKLSDRKIELVVPDLNKTLNQLQTLIKNAVRFIPAFRGKASTSRIREIQIETRIVEHIKNLGLSDDVVDEDRWHQFRRDFEESIDGSLRALPDQVYIEQHGRRFPFAFVGGGNQGRFAVQYYLTEPDFIYLIEEPEVHQHPRSSKLLRKYLEKQSKSKQLLVSTHSPIFLDKNKPENNWIVQKRKLKTTIYRVEDLRRAIRAVGASPFDRLVPDKVLLVEGASDALFLQIVAKRFGYDISRCKVVPIHGKDKGKYNFDAWLPIIRGTQIKLFLMLDLSAKGTILNLVRRRDLEQDDYVLLPGDLEDIYPPNLLAGALNNVFGLEVTLETLPSCPRVKEIEKLLRKAKVSLKGWKVPIAEYVAKKIKKTQLITEIRKTLQNLVKEN